MWQQNKESSKHKRANREDLPRLMGDLRLTPTLTAVAEASLVRLRGALLVTDWFAVDFAIEAVVEFVFMLLQLFDEI